MASLSFSGHQTFHCRHFWLKKGFDFVKSGYQFNEDQAVVRLGVGKNMVQAIQFWMKAFNVADDNYILTDFSEKLFGPQGWDPYLEDEATLWLLHYMLVSKSKASIYGLFFNEFRRERIEFNKSQLLRFLKRYCDDNNTGFNEKTLLNDVSVLLRNYLRPSRATNQIEDDFSTLLIDLNLIKETPEKKIDKEQSYRIEINDKPSLPVEVILFSILDQHPNVNSLSYDGLLRDRNSIGNIFALNQSGVLEKIVSISQKYPFAVYKEDAGVREIQLKAVPDKWEVLKDYYVG